MEEGNLAVLVDAKTEYTYQFIHIIKPSIYKCVNNFFINFKNKKYVLKKFQEELSLIPLWNQTIIDEEYNNIVKTSKCDWLDELITAVFVSHTRILTSINMNKEKGKINLKIPKTSYFIHKCYIDVARNIWKNSFLFDDRVSNQNKQKNRRDCEKIIENTIIETIRKEIPLKDILKEYLGNDYINYNTTPIRKSVINKLENCSEEKLNQLDLMLDKNEIKDAVIEAAEEAEKSRLEEAEKSRLEEAEKSRLEEAEKSRLEAEKSRLEEAEKSRLEEAETSRLEEAETSRLEEAETSRLEEAETSRLEEAETSSDNKENKHISSETNIENLLKIEELDLDKLNLNNYEEIYLDEPVEVNKFESKPNSDDIKKISLTDKNNKHITEVINLDRGVVVNRENNPSVLNKYKEKSNFKFF